VVLVFMEALELEPPLTLFCSDIHLQMEGYPVEQGGGDRDSAAAARAAGEQRRVSAEIQRACPGGSARVASSMWRESLR
jgi:hypothetical protein